MKDSTALETWTRFQDIFQDNKNSRAIYLENIFTYVSIEQFPNATTYCQRLKSLGD